VRTASFGSLNAPFGARCFLTLNQIAKHANTVRS